jgi:hypothetical protein
MGAARSGESRCGLRTEKGSAISALSSSRVGGGPVSSGFLVEFVIYSTYDIPTCNISALAGSSIVSQNNVWMCHRQGSNSSYMQDFCAVLCVPAPIRIPEHSPLARRCRWRLEHARLSIHDARFYNLLYVKSQRHCDTASPSWASRSSMLE